MSLLAEERKKIILQELDDTGKVEVILLSKRLQVSNETIRRDMDVLEELGKLKRVYGGAVKIAHKDGEPAYNLRRVMNYAEKQAIGRQASELLKDGDTIFLDTGTTVLELARSIAGKKRITIITNSLPAVHVLVESLNQEQFTGQVILLGGEISPKQQSISGLMSHEMLQNFYVDKAFLSVGGISPLHGITDFDMNESLTSRMAAKRANEVIVLADHSKIGGNAFCHIAPIEVADMIISDQDPPVSWIEDLATHDITWIKVSLPE
ncbi:DeoR/GlpR family DNA-binding transcription regulator [Cohnella abietis]|uniref:DeoR family transcriptional regulator n=1 Tax=Cohnella abietis TaxID=2507935 RepID=A0A3T1CYC6_9BACL|nr:DeoR/GlpR family DNA-binding transcription regulator [Cohnella abietis]BBI30853.1 DeoR family transcriptional regulator [Cohnella abietis]